ncbi:photosynthetic complex putative assembly protein PuhB [Roseobacteraceae bacterium S113]
MSDDDITFEPIPGLPETLPEGEDILWQGRPQVWALARQSMWLNWVIGYFVLIAVWRVGSLSDLMPLWAAASAAIPFLVIGAVCAGIILLTAWVQARETMYTVTSARIVMRIGAALTLTLNLPYREIAGADLDLRSNGVGTIALQTKGSAKLSYLACWPHVRPWHANPTQPALRCIADAAQVADHIAGAAQAFIHIDEPSQGRTTAAQVAAE